MKTEVPVRSPVLKHRADWLVVGWVTTSESQLLIVFAFWAKPDIVFGGEETVGGMMGEFDLVWYDGIDGVLWVLGGELKVEASWQQKRQEELLGGVLGICLILTDQTKAYSYLACCVPWHLRKAESNTRWNIVSIGVSSSLSFLRRPLSTEHHKQTLHWLNRTIQRPSTVINARAYKESRK